MDTAYESKQAILEEAGLAPVVLAENLTGMVDGHNKVFTTIHKPLCDANYDDLIDASDVTVYVNGAPVTVSYVDAVSGAITLLNAPAVDTEVTGDYVYSPIKDIYAARVREEAQDHINEIMSTLEPTPYTSFTDDTPTPSTIRRITRWFAAGMLLSRDYGSGTDTDKTSKDGALKMKTADDWLMKYLEQGGFTGGNTNPFADADVRTDRSLFGRRDRERLGTHTPTDDSFMLDLPANGWGSEGDYL